MKKIMKLFLIALLVIPFVLQCKKDDSKSSEKSIVSFSLSQQISDAVIDPVAFSVSIVVENGTDLTALQPTIVISEKASISPASGQMVDFSGGPVSYTVTAEDNSTQLWRISVTEEQSSAAYILTFTIPDQVGNTIYADSSISVKMAAGTDLSALIPVITISPNAIVLPESGVTTDFSSGPVIYTVTAQDGTVKHYEVTVTKDLYAGKDILSFTVDNQVGVSTISSSWVSLEVSVNVDLKTIAPEITVSPGATITPASGTAVDFSAGYADYKVTSESGIERNYRVYINYAKITADNANYQYYGRIDFTNSQKPKLWAAGSSIKAKFTGKYCAINLNDQNRWGNFHNYLVYVLDDQEPVRLKLSGTENNILVSNSLTDGEHTIEIYKSTEANIGYIEFLGLRVESLVALPAKPDRKIEFIGNSITCGCGSDNSAISCTGGDWYETDNAYASYGAEISRRLNTQFHLTSVGGIGLIRSCCDNSFTMPDVFGTIEFNGVDSLSRKPWVFSNYIPDVVTISLGQNDGPQASDSAKFCSTYISFIATIRSKYPDAQIVLLTSPMSSMPILEKYINGVVDHYTGAGDSKVSKYFFTKAWNGGCSSHPNVAQHQEIADELETYLKGLMGW